MAQTIAEIEVVASQWEKAAPPTLLNIQENTALIADYIAREAGGFWSVRNIHTAVAVLGNKLQYAPAATPVAPPAATPAAVPAPARPKGSIAERLRLAGVQADTAHQSVQDKLDEAAKLATRAAHWKENGPVAMARKRAEKSAQEAAENVRVFRDDGRVDYSATASARAEAKLKNKVA